MSILQFRFDACGEVETMVAYTNAEALELWDYESIEELLEVYSDSDGDPYFLRACDWSNERVEAHNALYDALYASTIEALNACD